MANESPDILHPLSSLEWEECPSLPVGMSHAQTVYLNGTLYVGGGYTLRSTRDDAKLYSCKPGVDNSWTVTDTPTYFYALTTYNSQLVLVGGREYPSKMTTNKIYTLVDGEFLETLPPMIEKRDSSSAVSSGSVLVVAGGYGESELLSVEVFKDGKWTSAPSLPSAGSYMSSVLDGDQWYLVNWDKQVFRVSLQSLLSSTEQSPWETLPDVSNNSSAVALFGSHIVSIGGDSSNPTSSIHALSSDTQSWVHVADLPEPLHTTSAITLPTGELMIIGGISLRSNRRVVRVRVRVKPFDPDSLFSVEKINRMKCSSGISLVEALVPHNLTFPDAAGFNLQRMYLGILKQWEAGGGPYRPTWSELFRVLKELELGDLAIRIEKYLGGSLPVSEHLSQSPQQTATEGDLSEVKEEEDDETSEQAIIRLNHAVMDHVTANVRLRGEINGLSDVIEQQKVEIDDLRRSLPVKLEPTDPLYFVKVEPSYQPSTSTHQLPKKEEVQEPQPKVEAGTSNEYDNVKVETEVQQLAIENLPAPVETETPFNLPGVEVVGETSVTVTNSVQTFQWPDYGFNLHIPQDSLPAGVDQCRLRIIASVAGQYQFPDNHELVSGVYWVRPEPPCRFKQPLTAELQHCAKMTSSTKLTFVRAVCSQKSLPYTFKKLEGRGLFTDQSSYGSLQVDHFSGLAVTGENVERLYTASLYYLGLDPCSRDIHFVVNWDDEPHITNVVQFYESKKALLGHNQEVEFEDDKVSLDIPMTGTNVKGGWTIVPMFHPTVTKKQVDHFKPGRRIPCCQLKAKFLNKRKKRIPSIFHQVKLVGAKDPYNVITMDFDPNTINLPHMSTTFGDLAALGSTISTEDVSHSNSQLALPSTSRGPVVTPPPTLTGQSSALVPFGNFFNASNMDQGTHSLTLSNVPDTESTLSTPARGSFPQHFSLEQSHSSLTVSPATNTPPPPPAQFWNVYQRNTSGMPLYPPHGSYQSITGPSQTSAFDSQIQDLPKTSLTFENLNRELKTIVNWHTLAIHLGIPQFKVKEIEQDNSGYAKRKAAFVDYIVKNSYQFTWDSICRALEEMDEGNLAIDIRSKYCKEHSETTQTHSPKGSVSVGEKRKQEESSLMASTEEAVPTPGKRPRPDVHDQS